LVRGSRLAEGVPEVVCRGADLIWQWIGERGAAWKEARRQRSKEAKREDARRVAEALAAVKAQAAAEEAAAVKAAADAVAAQVEAARVRALAFGLNDFTDESDEDGDPGEVGAGMDVDAGTAPGELAVTASTGGTVADDKGEDEAGERPVKGKTAGGAPSVGRDSVEGRAAGVVGGESPTKKTAAESVSFRGSVHEVSFVRSSLGWLISYGDSIGCLGARIARSGSSRASPRLASALPVSNAPSPRRSARSCARAALSRSRVSGGRVVSFRLLIVIHSRGGGGGRGAGAGVPPAIAQAPGEQRECDGD
jgi:hypothetical protein